MYWQLNDRQTNRQTKSQRDGWMHGCMAKGEGGTETRRWRRNHMKVEGIMWFVWRV